MSSRSSNGGITKHDMESDIDENVSERRLGITDGALKLSRSLRIDSKNKGKEGSMELLIDCIFKRMNVDNYFC